MQKTIDLPENSKLNNEIIEQLDNLISFSPPSALRKSLLRVYLPFLIHEHEALPMDFGDLASDMYMLVEFLTRVEEELNSRKTASS